MRQCPTCSELFDDHVGFCPHDGDELKKPDRWLGRELGGGVELRKVAGRGAMGTVYEAWQFGMERRVAVKILHGDLSRDPEYIERFNREARAIARINHPNIVSVYLLGEVDKRPYIIMEYVEGKTVLDHIKDEGVLEPHRVARIVRQVVSALADAHATSVIHRDLKPSNILLSQRRRAADFVKMLDFGVAKITDATDSKLTQDGYVYGTPAYLSPEQANGVKLDHRCDLYSLGVSMFEMLTGDLPFRGNQVKLLLSHAREQAPRAHEVNPDVPIELSDLVASLLEKKPDRRPDSAEAVADALDRMTEATDISPWASAVWSGSEVADVSTAIETVSEPIREPIRESARESEETELMVTTPHVKDAAGKRRRKKDRPAGPRVRPGTADPPWARGDDPDAAWASRARMTLKQKVRGRGGWLIAALIALVATAGALLVLFGPLNKYVPTQLDLAVAPVEVTQPPAPIPVRDVPRESVMLGKDGYALRVLKPKELVAGVTYEISVDVWDPDGEPIGAGKLPVELSGPAGKRELTAAPGLLRGRFSLEAGFAEPGDYEMRIYPPSVDEPAVVHVVVVGSDQGS